MIPALRKFRARCAKLTALAVLVSAAGCVSTNLQPWHTARLSEEFTAAKADSVRSFADYLQLEDRLYAELAREVYAQVPAESGDALSRYSAGSAADPRRQKPDWNRSFDLAGPAPVGGALLLHGMSDSPYSLRALAQTLVRHGYRVVGLRLPGHGAAPSGLRHVNAEDMIAAVRLAMAHLAAKLGERPIHVVGYSTGASLALDYALDAMDGSVSPVPASLVLISPAIRIHRAAALADFTDSLSALPGFSDLAYLQVLPEFDPYKYNSFATNASDVVRRLTRSVDRRLDARVRAHPAAVLPPTLVFKSTVDSTVTTEAVVDRLLARLAPHRHELVLFDVNRREAKSVFLASNPGPLTRRLMNDGQLPFTITLIANAGADSSAVVAIRKPPFSQAPPRGEPLGLAWPPGVISLSHVALPIPPNDPLYGSEPPARDDVLFLGDMAMRGERGLLTLPPEWLLRMRYNPFYRVLDERVLEWFAKSGRGDGAAGSARANLRSGPAVK